MSQEINSQRLDGLGVALLGDEDCTPNLSVGSQGHIGVTASARCLVDSQRRDSAEVG